MIRDHVYIHMMCMHAYAHVVNIHESCKHMNCEYNQYIHFTYLNKWGEKNKLNLKETGLFVSDPTGRHLFLF